jgi:hypothetical protein
VLSAEKYVKCTEFYSVGNNMRVIELYEKNINVLYSRALCAINRPKKREEEPSLKRKIKRKTNIFIRGE